MTATRPLLINPSFCVAHDTGPGHPERPARLAAILRHFEESGIAQACTQANARQASPEEVALAHPETHIERVSQAIQRGLPALDADTTVSSDSLKAALLAAGAGLTAIDAMATDQATRAFCGVRPPGHHAEANRAMGFCLFNNVAIAAKYAQKIGLAERVFILDWDVHHGNGTQAIFEADASVFYYSMHQFPFYPGTGAAHERGTGEGKGFTLNRPLPSGTGDDAYRQLLENDLNTIAETFKPNLVIISAGFDAHQEDPLGGMRLSSACFAQMTQAVLDMAEHCADGKVLSMLEGGYDLAALVESVEKHVATLCDG